MLAVLAGVAAGVALISLAVLASLYLSSKRSLSRITQAVQALASGDLRQRLYPSRGQETVRLAHAINDMAEGFQRTLEVVENERNRLNAILACMADGVLLADAGRTVLLTNPAFERTFRVTATRARGRPVMEVVLDHEVFLLLDRCLKSGREQVSVLEIGPDHHFFRVVASPVEGVHGLSALLLFQDQTEMRRLDRTRREFVDNVSHELRTPLASIKVLVEALQEGGIEDSAVARDFLQKIVAEIDHLTTLADDLLQLSSVEQGRIPGKQDLVDLSSLLLTAVDRMQAQAARQGLALRAVVPPSLPGVLGDEARIRQVVLNLLHNAIKFTPPAGSITLSAESTANGMVLVKVRDTGIGIPPEDLPHVFERFYKADHSRSSEGAGLGLAIAKHIVQAHQGTIWVESLEGQGSTFFFTLPAVHQDS
jgi:two-component system phosphate regulon sensor histidine kinase PhoR